MNTKGIGLYLGVCFVGALLLEGILALYPGPDDAGLVSTIVLLPVPLIAMLIAAGYARDSQGQPLRIWPVPALPAIAAIVGVPLVFALVNGLMLATGLATYDGEAAVLMEQLPSAEAMGLAQAPSPRTVVVAYFLVTFIAGPTLLALIFLGFEIGWRGYLLPRLLPLGPLMASLLNGFLWALWLMPLAALNAWAADEPTSGLLGTLLLMTAVGFVLAGVWRRWRHVGLTSVVYGAFAAQYDGIWMALFPDAGGLWNGQDSLLAAAVWGVLGLAIHLLPESVEKRTAAPEGGVES
jgi:hypothetical protein